MAYSASTLTKIANLMVAVPATTPSPSLFYYNTADTLPTILAANYFNAATTLIAGSVIMAQCAEGLKHLSVTGVAAGVVSVADLGSAGVARGRAVTATAADTIVTGLGALAMVVVSFDSDPVDNPEYVSATIGDQAGAPAAGSFILKTWQNTSGNDPTPVAASVFAKKVSWIAYAA